MIRINLLPVKKEKQKETSRRLLILFAILILAEIALLYPLYASKSSVLDEAKTENQRIQATINQKKTELQGIEVLNAEKAQLQKQLDVLSQLESGRSGPVRVLDEIQIVLSQPRNDLDKLTFDKRDWSTKWDPERLWFNEFEERQGKFGLKGGARTNDDVAEFLLRLSTSIYFDNVRLVTSEQVVEAEFQYVSFEVQGDISYSVGMPAGG